MIFLIFLLLQVNLFLTIYIILLNQMHLFLLFLLMGNLLLITSFFIVVRFMLINVILSFLFIIVILLRFLTFAFYDLIVTNIIFFIVLVGEVLNIFVRWNFLLLRLFILLCLILQSIDFYLSSFFKLCEYVYFYISIF